MAVAAARPALATATKAPEPAASASADTAQSSEPAKQRRSTKQREKAAETSGASEEQQKQQRKSDAAAPSAVSSVLGFTNVGNTCYFNAATQALLTAAHYFPEHVHYAETLEAPNSPVLLTFRCVMASEPACLLQCAEVCTVWWLVLQYAARDDQEEDAAAVGEQCGNRIEGRDEGEGQEPARRR